MASRVKRGALLVSLRVWWTCSFAAPRVGGYLLNVWMVVTAMPVLNVVNVRDIVHRVPASDHPVLGKQRW